MPKPNNAPQVNIQRPCYAMASTDGQTADITMYGDIVEKQPIDRWTNEPIPGQYIVESEFLNDLAQIEGCSQITIRMDSLGGDAGVSILIHNRLRELAAKGTKLVCIVDGVAMYDVVAGTFLVVGLGEEDFVSLSPELAQKYEEEFHQPEAFLPLGRRLMVIPVPDESVQSDAEKAVSKPPVEHDR